MQTRSAVLVTRPAGQAAALCAGLEDIGFRARSLPMLELVASETLSELQQSAVQELDQYQHVIFISSNAVHFSMSWLLASWPTLPAGPTWVAIGEVTAREVRRYGVPVVSAGAGMTSESLLAQPEFQTVEGQRVLIVKGHGGRVSLRDTLIDRGARVDELCCYRRQCPAMAAGELARKIAQWQIGLILISSGEGLDNMLTLLGPEESSGLAGVPLIVPSERVARLAKNSGFATVHAAANASDAAMLRTVESMWQTTHPALEKNE
jgi:uroporphyrinogen-III synthase